MGDTPAALTFVTTDSLTHDEMLALLIAEVKKKKGKVLSKAKALECLRDVIGRTKASAASFTIEERDHALNSLKSRMDANKGFNCCFEDPTEEYGIPTGMM